MTTSTPITSTAPNSLRPATATTRLLADALVQLAEGNLGVTKLPDSPARRRMQAALVRALDELGAALRPLAREVLERETQTEEREARERMAARLRGRDGGRRRPMRTRTLAAVIAPSSRVAPGWFTKASDGAGHARPEWPCHLRTLRTCKSGHNKYLRRPRDLRENP